MRIAVFSDPVSLPPLVAVAKDLSPDQLVAITSEKVNVPVDELQVYGQLANDCWVDVISDMGWDLLLIPSTRNGREIAARVAARIGRPVISGALSLTVGDGLTGEKLVFGGRGLEKLQVDLPAIGVVELTGVEGLEGEPSSVTEISRECSPRVRVVERREKEAEVDLSKAEVIVAVGRGLRRKEDLDMIRKLAEALGGEVACTRPISADLKWLPEERHVGMTGARVRPKVYLALGISGQIQHVVGFRDADTVIAVNTDPDAPISEVSDVFIVGDLYEFVPALLKALGEE